MKTEEEKYKKRKVLAMVKVKKAPINRAEQIEKTLEQTKTIAKQLLKEIGIKIHILGFYYWLTTLMIIKENEMKQEEKNANDEII